MPFRCARAFSSPKRRGSSPRWRWTAARSSAGRGAGQRFEVPFKIGCERIRRERDEDLAAFRREDVLERQKAFGVRAHAFSDGEQAAEARIGFAIGRIGEQLQSIDGDETHAHDQLQGLVLLPRIEGADDAGETVAIGDGERVEAQGFGHGYHLGWMGRAAQEREVRRDGEFGVAGLDGIAHG